MYNSIIRISVFIGILLLNSLAYGADEVDLPFWAGKGARTDKRVLDIMPHCCCGGMLAIARVSRLPAVGEKDPLEPELALELNEKDEVVRRWPLPVDKIILAIKGEQILVQIAPKNSSKSVKAIYISPQGEVSKAEVPDNPAEPLSYKCPHLPEFGRSAYLRCWIFRDLSSGAIRRLAYQGPCT